MRALIAIAMLAGTASAEVTILATTGPVPAPNNTYAPANVVVVWVEDQAGTFVATLDRHAAVRKPHLVAWLAKAGAGDNDAVSGASRPNNAAPLSMTWDLRDRAGNLVADGTYTIRMELAEENSTTAAQNNQGTFQFVVSATAELQTGLANGGFTNVSIDFQPIAPPPPAGDAGVPDETDPQLGPTDIEGGCTSGGHASLFTALAWILAYRRRRRRA
jgi:hypothetical protein